MGFYAFYPPPGGSSLPTGAATAANQVLEIADLDAIKASTASIDTKLTNPLPVSGTVAVSSVGGTVAVTGPLTDAQLRASPVPVSGTVTTGGLTDTQLRASPVPVSGTVTANAGTGNFTVVQATGTNLHTVVDSGTIALSAGSAVIGHVIVDSGTITTGGLTDTQLRATPVPVSGTVTANAGTNLNTSALALDTSVTALQVSQASTTSGQKGTLTLGAVTTAAPTYTTAQSNPLSLTTAGALRVDGSATTQPVSLTSTTVTNTVTTSETTSGTSTLTNVSGSASSVSLLASNANRKQATFYNDSTAILYLKFGTTASTTSYTVQLVSGAYYELPNGKIYTGAIDGIWAAANGAVRITELT